MVHLRISLLEKGDEEKSWSTYPGEPFVQLWRGYKTISRKLTYGNSGKNDDFFKVQIVWIVLAPCSSGLLIAFQKVPFFHGGVCNLTLPQPFGRFRNNPKSPGFRTLTKCVSKAFMGKPS